MSNQPDPISGLRITHISIVQPEGRDGRLDPEASVTIAFQVPAKNAQALIEAIRQLEGSEE